MACNVLEHVVTLAISLINDGETPPSQFEKKNGPKSQIINKWIMFIHFPQPCNKFPEGGIFV
jgi:hypothetical protein